MTGLTQKFFNAIFFISRTLSFVFLFTLVMSSLKKFQFQTNFYLSIKNGMTVIRNANIS